MLRGAARVPARRPPAVALWGSSMGCIRVQTVFWLACAEGNDAPDRIVRRDADGHAISRNDLDAEAAHSAAELGQHFVAGVALHTIESAAVNRHHRALHVDKIVLAQLLAILSLQSSIVPHRVVGLKSGQLQSSRTASSTCF